MTLFVQGNDSEEEDADMLALQRTIKAALCRQRDDEFAELAYAAKSGDVEVVRNLLRRGVDLDAADYDGRTVLALVIHP